MPMSDFLENGLVDMLFRTNSFGKPAELWVALFTTATSDNGNGTEVPFAKGYARMQLDPLNANWAAPTGGDGVTSNTSDFLFTSAVSDWGTVTHGALYDTGSGGNQILHNALGASKTVSVGEQLNIPAGNFIVTLT